MHRDWPADVIRDKKEGNERKKKGWLRRPNLNLAAVTGAHDTETDLNCLDAYSTSYSVISCCHLIEELSKQLGA